MTHNYCYHHLFYLFIVVVICVVLNNSVAEHYFFFFSLSPYTCIYIYILRVHSCVGEGVCARARVCVCFGRILN